MELPIIWWLCVSLDLSLFPVYDNCTREPTQELCLQDLRKWVDRARAWRVRSGLPPASFLAACIPE